MFRELLTKDVLILGCGNVLFGDDAFGPMVARRLVESGRLPAHAHCEDVGTSVRDLLFNIAVSEKPPSRIVIVDAVQIPGRAPGDVFELDLDSMPKVKLADFSFHQCPTTSLLAELRDCACVDVRILAVQAETIPDHVSEGMSPPVSAAVDKAASLILASLRESS